MRDCNQHTAPVGVYPHLNVGLRKKIQNILCPSNHRAAAHIGCVGHFSRCTMCGIALTIGVANQNQPTDHIYKYRDIVVSSGTRTIIKLITYAYIKPISA